MDPKFPKIALIVVAVATLALGLYSHYLSTWVKGIDLKSNYTYKLIPYKYCEGWDRGLQCPNIALERFFVGMIIASLLWSIGSLWIAFYLNEKRGGINLADKALHALCGVLLFVASIAYIVSAEQIKTLFGDVDDISPEINFRHLEKIEAAVLGIIQVCLHLFIAIVLIVQTRLDQRSTPTTPAHVIVVERPIMAIPMPQQPKDNNPKYF